VRPGPPDKVYAGPVSRAHVPRWPHAGTPVPGAAAAPLTLRPRSAGIHTGAVPWRPAERAGAAGAVQAPRCAPGCAAPDTSTASLSRAAQSASVRADAASRA